jgi:hypothetical protein
MDTVLSSIYLLDNPAIPQLLPLLRILRKPVTPKGHDVDKEGSCALTLSPAEHAVLWHDLYGAHGPLLPSRVRRALAR